MSMRSPVVRSISFTQSSMSVSVLSPRKSILSSPTRSMSFIDHCVTISSCAPRYNGAYSVMALGAMTTPAAWTDA